MGNLAFFAVLCAPQDLDWDLTDAGLLGSLAVARGDATKRSAQTDAPDMEFAAAVVTMLDRDPATGTPLGHITAQLHRLRPGIPQRGRLRTQEPGPTPSTKI